MQIICQPLPAVHLLDGQTWVSVGERREEQVAPSNSSQNDTTGDPATEQALGSNALANRLGQGALMALDNDSLLIRVDGLDVEDEFDKGAGHEHGCQVRREVVVKEELATHDVEGYVVRGPGEEEETR